MATAGDPGSLTTSPRLHAVHHGFGPTQAALARPMKVVRRRVVTIESQAAVPMVAAQRYLDALEALSA